MEIERLKTLNEHLVTCAQSQMMNLDQVDTHELGEVIDMIKDLHEAMYYCSIVTAMEEGQKQEKHYGAHEQQERLRENDYNMGHMYYTDTNTNPYNRNQVRIYKDHSEYPQEIRDYREGRSPMGRKGYIEAKEKHQSKDTQMHELEKYLNELSQDIVEMMEEATPEERNMLQQKLNVLSSKIK